MRESEPGIDGLNSGTNGYIPNIWDNPDTDDFNHDDLKLNFDEIDQNLGRLDQERIPLRTVISWYRFPSETSVSPPTNWQVCDGRPIGSNDLGLDPATAMPDMRNQVLIGAMATDGGGSPAVSYRGNGAEPGSIGDGPTNSPGIGGQQGLNADKTVPAHDHVYDHIHQVGPVSNSSFETGTADSGDLFNAGGGSQSVGKASHGHGLSIYSSLGRDPTNYLKKLSQIGGSDPSQNANNSTDDQRPDGGNTGDPLKVSTSNATFGVLYLMKVQRDVGFTYTPSS